MKMTKFFSLVFTVFIVSATSTITMAQNYNDGYNLGYSDAETTYEMYWAEGCDCIYDLNGFIYFWEGYLENTKNNYCNAPTESDYLRGVVEGYHIGMVQLGITKYDGGYYYGSSDINCN